jgi:hypothetical protein
MLGAIRRPAAFKAFPNLAGHAVRSADSAPRAPLPRKSLVQNLIRPIQILRFIIHLIGLPVLAFFFRLWGIPSGSEVREDLRELANRHGEKLRLTMRPLDKAWESQEARRLEREIPRLPETRQILEQTALCLKQQIGIPTWWQEITRPYENVYLPSLANFVAENLRIVKQLQTRPDLSGDFAAQHDLEQVNAWAPALKLRALNETHGGRAFQSPLPARPGLNPWTWIRGLLGLSARRNLAQLAREDAQDLHAEIRTIWNAHDAAGFEAPQSPISEWGVGLERILRREAWLFWRRWTLPYSHHFRLELRAAVGFLKAAARLENPDDATLHRIYVLLSNAVDYGAAHYGSPCFDRF